MKRASMRKVGITTVDDVETAFSIIWSSLVADKESYGGSYAFKVVPFSSTSIIIELLAVMSFFILRVKSVSYSSLSSSFYNYNYRDTSSESLLYVTLVWITSEPRISERRFAFIFEAISLFSAESSESILIRIIPKLSIDMSFISANFN